MGSCQGSCFVNNQATKNVEEKVIENQVDSWKPGDKKKGTDKNKYVDIEEAQANKNQEPNPRSHAGSYEPNGYQNQRDQIEDKRGGNREPERGQRDSEQYQGIGPISQPIQTMKEKGVPNEEGNALIEQTLGLNTRKKLPDIQLENGAVFKGEWKNGMRDGIGIQQWPDGSKYEGEWLEDKAHGKGTLVHADGDIYEGYFLL